MNADLGKIAFTPEEIDDLRNRLSQFKDDNGLSWSDLGTATDVASGTLSSWVPGSYNKGNIYGNQEIPSKIHRFFLSHEEKRSLEAALPSEPDFQMTTSARRMLTCLAMAQLGDMALISSAPGAGKSASVKQYRATRAQVFVAVASPGARGVNTILSEILNAMGEPGAKGTPHALSNRVRNKVRNANSLIIIDEAQHLSPQALDEIRSIHDDTDCGVAFVGDETLLATLKRYPQLYSRLGIRVAQTRPTAEDVAQLAAAWGITRGPELAFLQEITRKSGGLRTLTKTMKLAVRAARAGGAPLDISDLRDAYAQRYGDQA